MGGLGSINVRRCAGIPKRGGECTPRVEKTIFRDV
jgi:hypothetical protein